MKHLKKRIERLEEILIPIQPLEEPKKPDVDTPGLTYESARKVRLALEYIQMKMIRSGYRSEIEGILDPALKQEAINASKRKLREFLEKEMAKLKTDKKITENFE